MLRNITSCFKLLSKRDKRIWFTAVILQLLLSALDLFGVLIIGIIGALSIRGIQNVDKGDRINGFLEILRIEGTSLQYQVVFLGVIAIGFFILKTLGSSLIQRRVIRFFCNRSAAVSSNLFRNSIESSGLDGTQEEVQKKIYSLTTGVAAIMNGVLVQALNILADVSLFLTLLLGLFVVEPYIGLSTLLIFSLTALILNKVMISRAFEIGKKIAHFQTHSSLIIEETTKLYRELFVSGKLQEKLATFKETREQLGKAEAEQRFMPFVSKYVFEVVIILSLTTVSALQFFYNTAAAAAANLGVFIAASVRIAPAILRIQQSFVSMKGNLGSSFPTLSLMKTLEIAELAEDSRYKNSSNLNLEATTNSSEVVLMIRQLNFQYRGANERKILHDVDLTLCSGEHLVVIGPSGSGKSTLVDLILGIREPNSGQISLFGDDPQNTIKNLTHSISYVPQKIWLTEGTVLENLVLGSSNSQQKNFDRLNFVLNLVGPLGIEADGLDLLSHRVGSGGSKLSGGQIQRIGVARALLQNPELLVLDEATNALDMKSQINLYKKIFASMSGTTIITITHNRELLRLADRILFLGKNIQKEYFSYRKFVISEIGKKYFENVK